MSLDGIIFFAVGAAAIAFAALMVMQKNPLMSAIYLIGNFFCLALLYLLLRAQLLAILQILVYTGAIMVLVVFVIMLLNLGDERRLLEKFDLKRTVGVVVAAGFLAEVLYIILMNVTTTAQPQPHPGGESMGTVESIGTALFERFLLPFEAISLVLLAAIVGAVVLAKRRGPAKAE